MMKKRIILILSTISIVVGSSYYMSGKLIQQNYNQLLAKLSKQQDIKVSLLSYDRGLFHSKAKIQFDLSKDGSDKEESLILEQQITHGPLFAVSTPNGIKFKLIASKISTLLDDANQKLLVQYTGNKKPFELVTVFDFSNNATTWLKLEGIDQTTPNKFNVAWATIVGEISHDLKTNNYNGYINLPKVSVTTPDTSFTMNELALNIDSTSKDKIFAGKNHLTLKSINFSRNNEEKVKLNNIVFDLELGVDANQKFAANLSLDVDSSQILQQQFAQDKISVKLENIPADSLPSLALMQAFSPRAAATITQQIATDVNSNLTVELPKHFTEALVTYASYEIYRNSMLGAIDQRSDDVIFRDITASIKGLIKGAVNQKLFIDQGAYYALNFGQNTQTS